MAVLNYLQQGQTQVVVERLQSEVIKDDEVISLDMIDDLKKTSVKFSERYPLDKLVHGKEFHSAFHEADVGCPQTNPIRPA